MFKCAGERGGELGGDMKLQRDKDKDTVETKLWTRGES